MKALHAIVAACTAVGFAGLVMQLANAREFVRLRPAANDEPVDVYVAMRDETANVDGFLVAALRMPNVGRVVVADDGSRDDTVERLAAYARTDPRVYWLPLSGDGGGKAAALAGAVHVFRPSAEWMLFLDADVRTGPAAAATLVAHARRRGVDAVSAWPRVATPSVWSLLLAPAVTLFLLQALPMRLARTSTDPHLAAGNGQCFLVSTAAYERSGGHAGIDDVVEDVALARSLKAHGARIALASAADVATVRGYESLRANVRGYGRSLYFGLGARGCVLFGLWQCALVFAPLPLFLSRALTAGIMRESAASIALAPLGALCGAAVALYAAVAGPRGWMDWRGRRL